MASSVSNPSSLPSAAAVPPNPTPPPAYNPEMPSVTKTQIEGPPPRGLNSRAREFVPKKTEQKNSGSRSQDFQAQKGEQKGIGNGGFSITTVEAFANLADQAQRAAYFLWLNARRENQQSSVVKTPSIKRAH